MERLKTKRSFTEGPLFFKVTLFALPIMLTSLLQLLYNTADTVVLGQFSGDPNALAAVGSTGSLTNLIVGLVTGISVGASVVIAQYYGAGRFRELSRAVHTSLAFAFIAGILVMGIGLLAAKPLLTLMGTKEEYFDQAHLYISIILCGLPASAIYNFGSTVLRATGDSKTPLMILSISGLSNVVLNLFFVIVFHMGVAGVAIATIVSQYISAVWIVLYLWRSKEVYRFRFRELCIDKQIFKRILLIGIPSGIQSSLFSISNMMVQSSVNTLSVAEVNGNTVAGQIEGYSYMLMNSYYQSTVTIVGQNFGANKLDRIKKTLLYALIQVVTVGLIVSTLELIFVEPISTLWIDMSQPTAPAVLAAVVKRTNIVLSTYVLCGVMEVLIGYLRGLGSSVPPMCCSVFAVCILRILYTSFIFPLPAFNTPEGLYIVYPISWSIGIIALAVISVLVTRKRCRPVTRHEN